MNIKRKDELKKILNSHGLRATNERIAMLDILARLHKPLPAREVQAALPAGTADLATIYRTLERFVAVLIAKKIDFQEGFARYELQHEHHHHIVCTECGFVEELDLCHVPSLEKKVISRSKRFNAISDHTLEFFGVCLPCRSRSKQ